MPTPDARAHHRPRTVLVVEDCDDDFDTVLTAHGRAGTGARLVRAPNADEAQAQVLAAAGEPFAFVLLDYHLPGMDGLELLKRLRSNPAGRCLPAVVYTTSIDDFDRQSFYLAGANAFHRKRVRYADSLVTLEAIFRYWLCHAIPPSGERPGSGRSGT